MKCAQVERFLQEQEPTEEEDEGFASDGVDEVAPKQTGIGFGSTLSEPMAAFLGEASLPRTQVGGMCLAEESGCSYIQHYIKFQQILDGNAGGEANMGVYQSERPSGPKE